MAKLEVKSAFPGTDPADFLDPTFYFRDAKLISCEETGLKTSRPSIACFRKVQYSWDNMV